MITITEHAGSKIKDIMTDEGKISFLRIGVQPGGCSGFSYMMGFDDEKRQGDIELSQYGIQILVDQESKKYLDGTVVDYKEAMMGGGFTIHNPNAVSSCGCGSSFRTEDDTGQPNEC